MTRRLMQWTRIACLCAGIGVAPAAGATAFSTNFSDLWWNPAESGWGANISQQADIMFVTFFVYGPSGQATWFAATLEYAGTGPGGALVWTGDLYQTTGPWFGATFFNPNFVSTRRVGTATFQTAFVAEATLSYNVDGTFVTKQIERQTLRRNDSTGDYHGGTTDVSYGCTNPALNNTVVDDFGALTVAQNGPLISLKAPTCTFTGNYVQQGQIGRADTSYACSNGATGTATFFDMHVESSGIVGRYTGRDAICLFDGNIGGVRLR